MAELIESVAGLQFYQLPLVAESLQQGIRLRWQRDPDNWSDRNATSLWLDRAEAVAWEILELIPANEPCETWQIGHIPRGLAADLAPLLDEGHGMDVFVHGGTKDGAWSLAVRLEGAAIDVVAPVRAARAADAQAEAAAVRAVEKLRNEINEGLDRVSRRFLGWDGVLVELEKSWTDHRGRPHRATDTAWTPRARQDWWTGEQVRRADEAMRAPRRAAATAAFQPIIDAEIARKEEARERRRQRAAERREAGRRAEAARLVARFNETGRPVAFSRGVEPYLPWLRRNDIEARGMNPEHCRIVAEGTTAYNTPLYLYLPEVDQERVAAGPKRKAPRAADPDDMPIPW
ncbi:hypothetical protein GBZ48_18400 [Azospirillum melinis]|uniref:HIRAN domain-containing protein n=1 Tax=Azospirillum melinis TaxID=328839 RepID=A0ABX2KII5_9PROT|nr:hypothetical protein [Azospirillum melinis]NUB01241.1 hypothetical protein [Azospirillum melinis]